MPFLSHSAFSSSLIGREASLMSVSPLQKRAKPSPVPGPSTLIETPELSSEKSCATSELMGCTVEEPDTTTFPERPPVAFLLEQAAPNRATAPTARSASHLRRFVKHP